MNFSNSRKSVPIPARVKVSGSEVKLRRILRESPQDLWLDTIRRTRSDAHNSLIFWMLNQPECDFSIAVHAFYRSDPILHIDNPKPLSLRAGADNLFAVVLVNWDTGFFRSHNLKVEPVDAHPRIVSRLNERIAEVPRGELPFNIPRKMLDPTGGEAALVPQHLSPDDTAHLWPLYTDLGLRVPDVEPGLTRRMERAKSILRKVGLSSN